MRNRLLQNHRTIRVGKDLQDHLIQQPTYHQYFPTKPYSIVVPFEQQMLKMGRFSCEKSVIPFSILPLAGGCNVYRVSRA